MEGLQSVHAFNKQKAFRDKNMDLVNNTSRTNFAFFQLNRWVGCRIDWLTTLVCTVIAIACIVLRDYISPSLAGLALVYSLATGGILQYGTRMISETEAMFTSVERLTYFETSTPLEAAAETDKDEELRGVWPSEGAIKVNNLTVTYRSDLPPVLKGSDIYHSTEATCCDCR